MNPLRHDFIQSLLASGVKTEQKQDSTLGAVGTDTLSARRGGHGIRYLDIGCGGGIFAESAARLPGTASVTAIDPSAEVLHVARAHARRDPLLADPASGRLTYVNTTIEDFSPSVPPATAASEDGTATGTVGYDVVTCFEVLEHVRHPARFLDLCARHVRPPSDGDKAGGGGWLVLSTIARTWLSWLVTNVVAEDILRIVPRGTHDWNKYVNPDELRAYFAGMEATGHGSWAVDDARVMGVVYVPGLGWKEVNGSERFGNYFFAVRRTG